MANAPSMEKGRKGLSPETLGGRGVGQQAPGRWRGRLGQEGGRQDRRGTQGWGRLAQRVRAVSLWLP